MSKKDKKIKVAITHDYLINYGGAELVLKTLLETFPDADLFTPVFWMNSKYTEFLAEVKKHKIFTSAINKYPVFKKAWKLFLPNFANFFESANFNSYDVVISVSSSFAKWVNRGKAKHIAYINTPPRFLWGMETSLYHKIPSIAKVVIGRTHHDWKDKDLNYAKKANILVANSTYTNGKIKEIYKRDSLIVFPPVEMPDDTENTKSGEYYLVINRLVSHKKIDEVIKAFKGTKRKLVIIGEGPELPELKELSDEQTFFTGYLDEKKKREYLAQAKAVIYPGVEDFGIGMVEALSYGKPVVAYKGGGALDIVDSKSGVLFDENTSRSINAAILKLENKEFDSEYIKKSSLRFSKEKFKEEMTKLVKTLVK